MPSRNSRPVTLAGAIRIETGGAGPGLHPDAAGFDDPLQRVSAAEVELRRHQAIRGLDDGALDARALQRSGRFEAEQPAADHRAGEGPAELGGPPLDECAQPLDIVERAVDEAAVESEAVDRELGGIRSGREHEPVVGDAESRTWSSRGGRRGRCGRPRRRGRIAPARRRARSGRVRAPRAEDPPKKPVSPTRSYGCRSSSPMTVRRQFASARLSRLSAKRWATIPAPTTTTWIAGPAVVLMSSPYGDDVAAESAPCFRLLTDCDGGSGACGVLPRSWRLLRGE